MVIVTAAWQAKAGKEAELRKQLEAIVEQVRKHEPNCLLYTLHQDLDDKTKFFFYEQYADMKAVDVHKATAHFKALVANTEQLIAKPVDVHLLTVVK